MYPLARFIKVLFKARKKPKIGYLDSSSIEFRCRPWDLYMYNEMNNGRVMTLYDLGRFDLSYRNRFAKVLMKNRWATVVALLSIRAILDQALKTARSVYCMKLTLWRC